MKKMVLGLMLIVGSLSFASGESEGNFVNNLYKFDKNFNTKEIQKDEYISRGENKIVNELSSSEVILIKGERGKDSK